jgi:hypothetical protein
MGRPVISNRRTPRLGQRRVGAVRPDAGDQIIAVHADRHVPAGQEGESAEHLLLGDAARIPEPIADALDQHAVVRHDRRIRRGVRPALR